VNFKKFAASFTLLLITACGTSGNNQRTTTLNTLGTDNTNSTLMNNPLSGASATLNLFGNSNGSTSVNSSGSTYDAAPSQVVNSLPPQTAATSSCLSNAVSAQWACLGNQPGAAEVTADTVVSMGASTLRMMNDCSGSVRKQVVQQLKTVNPNNPEQLKQVFFLAKQAMAQCYYRINSMQGAALPWSQNQQQIMNYNAGNIWTLKNSLGQ
jgi:hypothetical protein